jgi:hypothetical protein
MTPFLLVPLQVLGCVAAADFLSGFFHWAEDAYGEPHWPLVGKAIIQPNLEHHRDPRAMTKRGWWRSADVQVVAGGAFLLAAWAFRFLTWRLGLGMALLVNANEVHKWTHRSREENGPFITWLQDHGLVASRLGHARHHRMPRTAAYCTLTDHLNPLLDRAGFWSGLEATVFLLTGVRRRQEARPQAA